MLDVFISLHEWFVAYLQGSGCAQLLSDTATQAGRKLVSAYPLWNENIRDPVPTLYDAEVDRQAWIAQTDAPLFFNAVWAATIAHGSDMMFPITKVAEKLLTKQEKIVSVSGGFSKMVDHDIHIVVWDASRNPPSEIKESTVCWTGEYITSSWRRLTFAISMIKSEKITEIRWENPLTENLVQETNVSLGQWYMILDPEKLKILAHDFAENTACMTSMLYEIMTNGSSYIFGRYCFDEQIEYDKLLVRDIRNLPVKLDIEEIGDSPKLHGKIMKSRVLWEWTYLFVDMNFSFIPWATTVCLAYKRKLKKT